MANNITVTDSAAATKTLKTTDNGGVHTPHHNVDALPADPFGANADAVIVTDAAGSISGKLRGLVKWAFERMPASLGQKTMAASLPVVVASDQGALPVTVPASELFLGKVGNVKAVVSVSPTLQTGGAYATGQCLGSKLTISGAARVATGSGLIESVTITDKSGQNAALDLILFDSDPSATTFTDNAALSMNVADVPKIIGVVSFVTGDYVSFTGGAAASKKAIGLAFALASGSTLYGILVSRGAPTYTVVSALSARVGIAQD